jgi:AcrR family transcriptional regulator
MLESDLSLSFFARILPPVPKPARTQRERREETRGRLLAATQAALVERGYAGATTTEICRRAGVSQGALFKHFASKGELLAASAEQLFGGLIDAYREEMPRLAGVEDRAAAAVALLWDVFEDARLLAAIELYGAARTDRELAARLAPVADRHGENLHALARELFPEAAARNPDYDGLVAVVVQAIQGATLGSLASGDRRAFAPMLALLTDWVRKAVG